MIREFDIDPSAPIILLAVARSGSSLLRSLLTVHPEVRLLESSLISAMLRAYPELTQPQLQNSEHLIAAAHQSIVSAFYDASMEDPDMGLLHKKKVTRWGFTVHQVEQPASLRLLEQGFPNAHWIHLIRDGRAVAASWVDNWELATGLPPPACLKTAAETWAQSVLNVENGPNHHRVKLEDLTSTKKRHFTFEALLKYLDIDISPRQNAFLESWPAINTSRRGENLAKRVFSADQRSVFKASSNLEKALDFFSYPDFKQSNQS
jgi:hypothetical protein